MSLRPRLLRFPAWLLAPALAATASTVHVDEQGVLRQSATGDELALFGVNYCAPFAHGFRALQRLGVRVEDAIAADVYHFARLGFDVYRVHVWDREISDEAGNLLVNEHVEAFDYLLAELKARGIKYVLTPLQFGNAGYPEPGEPLPGFSSRYGKRGSLEDRSSWPLQERYLQQFLQHRNPHTGLAYKDDPDLIAVEICNEPGHFEYDLTLEYINRMVAAVRSTGFANPVLYNMSHGLPVHEAYLDANVQGGTFQWYPSNLVAGHEQRGNFLPYVDVYPIPFSAHPKFQRQAKVVYEFDPADIGRAYLYPAMARTFRQAGFQVAAQFAYDPLHLAPFNTEYQTHYLNLAYSPQKALGMLIAGEVFRRIPRAQPGPRYPDNTRFGDVRLHYPADLAELVTRETFLHTAPTATAPPEPAALTRLAGFGSSPVVHYAGRGAYFLDRLAPGVWRLEVMPDALWTRDPFGRASSLKRVAEIAWNTWPMQIALPDLGPDFAAVELRGDSDPVTADRGVIPVRPGVYRLTRPGVDGRAWSGERRWERIRLGEYVAPPPSLTSPLVLHEPPVEVSAGERLRLRATVACPRPIKAVDLVVRFPPEPWPRERVDEARAQPGGGNTPGPGQPSLGGARVVPLQHVGGLDYAIDLPAEELRPGLLTYHIVVTDEAGALTAPSAQPVSPADWRFHGDPWRVRVVASDQPLLLFSGSEDAAQVTANHRDVRYPLVPSDRPGISAMQVIETRWGDENPDHSFRFFCRARVEERTSRLRTARRLVLYGRSATGTATPVQVALVTQDGFAYGAVAEVSPQFGRTSVELSELKPVRSPNIPHGYPSFLPFWSPAAVTNDFNLPETESVLVSIEPGLSVNVAAEPRGVEIERIWLE